MPYHRALGSIRSRVSWHGETEIAAPWRVIVADYGGAAIYKILSGVLRMRTGTETVTLKTGDMVMFPSGDPHEVAVTDACDRLIPVDTMLKQRSGGAARRLILDGSDPRALVWSSLSVWEADAAGLSNTVLPPQLIIRADTPFAHERFELIRSSLGASTDTPLDPAAANLCINALAVLLLGHSGGVEEGTGDALVDRAITLIHNQSHLLTGAKDVAERLGVAAGILSRRFKSHLGVTPHAYLVATRMERAKDLLRRSPDMPVDEVRAAIGLASTPSFIRAFQVHTGQTPGAFARQIQVSGKPSVDEDVLAVDLHREGL